MTASSRPSKNTALLRPVGIVSVGLGGSALACALVGLFSERHAHVRAPHGGTASLLFTALLGLGLGAFLLRRAAKLPAPRRRLVPTMTLRRANLAVALVWILAGVLGAVPLAFGGGLDPADAFFESVSGLTTTGATTVGDIEGTLSRPILLWRALLQWLGGMGIVVLFVAVFPSLGIGAKQMARGEVPGTRPEGLRPRIAETAVALWKLYVVFTGLAMVTLLLLGMGPFEALCHALTVMSTGGFSTRDASIGAYDSAAIEYALSVFMYVAAVNFGLYYAALRLRSIRAFWRSTELKAYLLTIAISVSILTIGIVGVHGGDWLKAFRRAFFMVATTISSTGYGADDTSAYPPLSLFVIILLMFAGGCSGSTAGGLKTERIVLALRHAATQLTKHYRPHRVKVVQMDGRGVTTSVLDEVGSTFLAYGASLLVGMVLVLLLEDVGIGQSFGSMLTCLSNMGPAPFYEGVDNFVQYGPITKIVFSLAMLLGRLEFFTLLALLTPSYWRGV